MHLRRSLGATVLLALIHTTAFAASYVGSAYESFSYAAGNMLNTYNGGTGWNATGSAGAGNTSTWGVTQAPNGTAIGAQFALGATAANQTITSASLDYTASGYPSEAGASALLIGGAQAGRNIGQTVDSGTLYFSFLVKKTVDQVRTVNLAFFGSTGDATAPQERVAIGQIANNTNLKLADGSADPDAVAKANKGEFAVLVSNVQSSTGVAGIYTAATPISFALNTTFLVVGKIEFNYAGGAADRLTLYINPSNLSSDGALTPYLVVNNCDFGALIGLRLFAGANQTGQTVGTTTGLTFSPSAAEFDELRLGATYNAVTGVTASTPFQDWLSTNFTTEERALPAVSGNSADPDNDGVVNLLEYAFGSDPRSSATGPAPAISTGTGTLVLDYPAPRSDLTYAVETSTDLATWTTTGVTDSASATAGWRSASVARGDNARVFLRVRVTQLN